MVIGSLRMNAHILDCGIRLKGGICGIGLESCSTLIAVASGFGLACPPQE